MDYTHYFNPKGTPILDEKLHGSKPTGFIDFNRSRYQWAKSIYDNMLANTWFTTEVNTSNEKKNFTQLTENEQNIYKYVFAQLSFNDCLIDGTEILTNNGFVDFNDLTETTKVATYNKDTQEIGFEVPKRIIKDDYEGAVFRFKSTDERYKYEAVVTPNHRVLTYQDKDDMSTYNIKYAMEDIPTDNFYPLSSLRTGKDETYIEGKYIEKRPEYYRGKIHCVEVSTGFIVCRYNGNVFVTGNSIQSRYLADFQNHITNSVVKATLLRQSFEEVLHSDAYAMLLDACGNSNEVFDLYKKDDKLAEKNKRISEQFARHIEGTTSDKLLLSAIASVNLEGIYFLTGFSFIYTIGDKVQGARDTIAFINRDEFTHLPLFANISKGIIRENNLDTKVKDKAIEMIEDAVKIELDYSLYLLEKYPILGIYKQLLIDTIHNYANDRLKAIGLPKIYDEVPKTSLQLLIDKNVKNINSVKSNFFESNVKNYSKNSIDLDDF